MTSSTSLRVKGMNVLRTLRMRSGYREVSRHLHAIRTDHQLADFHTGHSTVLPDYYEDKYERALGKYAQILPRGDRAPVFGKSTAPTSQAQPLRFVAKATSVKSSGGAPRRDHE